MKKISVIPSLFKFIIFTELEADFFRKNENGAKTMPSDELGKLLRVAGLNPTEAEIQQLKKELDAIGNIFSLNANN